MQDEQMEQKLRARENAGRKSPLNAQLATRMRPEARPPIYNKLKAIKERKPYFNEMANGLEELITPVTSATMTKNMNWEGMEMAQCFREGRDAPVLDGAQVQRVQVEDQEPVPGTSGAGAGAGAGGSGLQVQNPDSTVEIVVSPERFEPITESKDEPAQVEEEVTYMPSTMFLLQPDGSYELYTSDQPVSQEPVSVREIGIEDGPLIILTGDDGQVHYNPSDAVAIDIDDAPLYILDTEESVVCYVEDADGNVHLDMDNVIEYLPEEPDMEQVEQVPLVPAVVVVHPELQLQMEQGEAAGSTSTVG